MGLVADFAFCYAASAWQPGQHQKINAGSFSPVHTFPINCILQNSANQKHLLRNDYVKCVVYSPCKESSGVGLPAEF